MAFVSAAEDTLLREIVWPPAPEISLFVVSAVSDDCMSREPKSWVTWGVAHAVHVVVGIAVSASSPVPLRLGDSSSVFSTVRRE